MKATGVVVRIETVWSRGTKKFEEWVWEQAIAVEERCCHTTPLGQPDGAASQDRETRARGRGKEDAEIVEPDRKSMLR
eukprot:2429691-Rhodomonas_salina.1